MDVGDFFDLDSVQLRIDDKPVSNTSTPSAEVAALLRGGVHRIYPATEDRRARADGRASPARATPGTTGAAPRKVEKGIGAKFVELRISDRESKQQPSSGEGVSSP
jgi:hypothetical protein